MVKTASAGPGCFRAVSFGCNQTGPHSFMCKLACPGLVSHVIGPMKANRCGMQPQSHYFILFYFSAIRQSDNLRWYTEHACYMSDATVRQLACIAKQDPTVMQRPRVVDSTSLPDHRLSTQRLRAACLQQIAQAAPVWSLPEVRCCRDDESMLCLCMYKMNVSGFKSKDKKATLSVGFPSHWAQDAAQRVRSSAAHVRAEKVSFCLSLL